MPRLRTARIAGRVALVTGLVAANGWTQVPDVRERLAELEALVDPAKDDWPAETWAARAERELAALAALLEHEGGVPDELARFVGPAARSTPLRPGGLRPTTAAGGLEITRLGAAAAVEPTLSASQALRELVRPWPSVGERRVTFEIEGIELTEGAPTTTSLRFEAALRGGGRTIEQIAHWRVDWSGGVERADAPPRIETIRLEDYQEVGGSAPLFSEATSRVLPPGGDGADVLRHGSEYWLGRLDVSGEPLLFGQHGLALGDFDGDGREDLYVAMGEGLPNQLLLHRADGTLREAAAEAGVDWLDDTKGVLFADMDDDGDQDLLAAVGPTVVLCKNDGHGKCARIVTLRVPGADPIESLAAADYDLDGDLDLYLCRSKPLASGAPLPFQEAVNGPPNHLLRNDGDDRYADVTIEVGLAANLGRFSLAAAWADYDLDGDADLYVANEFGRDDLYRNDGGKFVDVAADAGLDDPAASSGVSWADFDLDGDLDLFVTREFTAAGQRIAAQPRFKTHVGEELRRPFQRFGRDSALFVNQGDGTFREMAARSGIRPERCGFGGRFVDLDNDGRDDVVVPAGLVSGPIPDDLSSFFWRHVVAESPTPGSDVPGERAAEERQRYLEGWKVIRHLLAGGHSWAGGERNRVYLNGADGRFTDVSLASGLDLAADGRAVAAADWDDDGDLDLWLRNRTGPPARLMRNEAGRGRHFIAFELVGTTSNRDAVGARVELQAGGARWSRSIVAGDGQLGQSSKRLHFGLGRIERVDRVVIHWPGGAPEVLRGLGVDRRYRIEQGTRRAVRVASRRDRLPAAVPAFAEPPTHTAVLLKMPLELPPSLTDQLYGVGGRPERATLVHLDSPEVVPCLAEPGELADRDRAHEAGLDLVEWSIGEPVSDELREAIDVLLAHVLYRHDAWSEPTSLLIDREANLQLVYLGCTGAAQALADAAKYAPGRVEPHRRTLLPGRWFYRTERTVGELAWALRDRGRRRDAMYYFALEEYNRKLSQAAPAPQAVP